jgi:hypothetical protein
MAGHETSRPATPIYLHVDLAPDQRAMTRTTPRTPSLGGTALPRPCSPSWRTPDYADFSAAGTAATSAFGPDIGIIRRSA